MSKKKSNSGLRFQPAGGNRTPQVPVGKKQRLDIERLAGDGRGIAFLDGRTWFVSGALEASGIPYIRMKIKAGYSVADIQQGLAAKLGKLPAVPEPMIKGTMKKGPTRPVRPLTPALSPSQLKASSTALVQIS